MKNSLVTLIAALALFVFGQASASTPYFTSQSLQDLSKPLVCAEEEDKKKKKGEDEEEPECD